MNDLVERPAIVRSWDELRSLAEQINAQHIAGQLATRKGLEHFRAAGEALLRAKSRCKHGRWLPWLKENVQVTRQQAAAYMRVAREWDKCKGALHLTDALRVLADQTSEDLLWPIEIKEANDAAAAQVPSEYWTALEGAYDELEKATEQAYQRARDYIKDPGATIQGLAALVRWAKDLHNEWHEYHVRAITQLGGWLNHGEIDPEEFVEQERRMLDCLQRTAELIVKPPECIAQHGAEPLRPDVPASLPGP